MLPLGHPEGIRGDGPRVAVKELGKVLPLGLNVAKELKKVLPLGHPEVRRGDGPEVVKVSEVVHGKPGDTCGGSENQAQPCGHQWEQEGSRRGPPWSGGTWGSWPQRHLSGCRIENLQL